MAKLKFALILIGSLIISSTIAGDKGHKGDKGDKDHKHHGAPLPILGVGLPSLAAAGIGYYIVVRRRRAKD